MKAFLMTIMTFGRLIYAGKVSNTLGTIPIHMQQTHETQQTHTLHKPIIEESGYTKAHPTKDRLIFVHTKLQKTGKTTAVYLRGTEDQIQVRKELSLLKETDRLTYDYILTKSLLYNSKLPGVVKDQLSPRIKILLEIKEFPPDISRNLRLAMKWIRQSVEVTKKPFRVNQDIVEAALKNADDFIISYKLSKYSQEELNPIIRHLVKANLDGLSAIKWLETYEKRYSHDLNNNDVLITKSANNLMKPLIYAGGGAVFGAALVTSADHLIDRN
ncbi:hypothetical protein O9G_002751 [Rozella allomycis CSF55]|uniref:Uncharacterized protein n=1 Tax=Rozella allomycis (strain CSF55) TaxID=988480 RepID=A0A075AWR4_ROZAC|nr:hypothetical protein O9G_002751 [Rozella allomycis CSF55]|eukprot:EPZ34687.1 hypothetical protein O9G_002751 [Rozella allomycis CSF55]